MLADGQSARSLVSFFIDSLFLSLSVSGIVLYAMPRGRVAYREHWTPAGMEKEQWGGVHMMFGGVFIVSWALHRYSNCNTFKTLSRRLREGTYAGQARGRGRHAADRADERISMPIVVHDGGGPRPLGDRPVLRHEFTD